MGGWARRVLALGTLLVVGCGADSKETASVAAVDGARCNSAQGCASGACEDGVCAGSDCSGGKACQTSWRCVHHDPDAITGFFGAKGSNVCVPTCGACPASGYCPTGGMPGDTPCQSGKPAPVVAFDQQTVSAKVGDPVKLSVKASSSNGKIVLYVWDLGPPPQLMTTSPEITRNFDSGGTVDIGVTVTDEAQQTAYAHARVEVHCRADGDFCDDILCCQDGLSCLAVAPRRCGKP